MNPEPQILEPPDGANNPQSPTEEPHYRKIAQLPKILRDRINSMLDDSLPYGQIVEKLEQSTDPPLPYSISRMNISRWKDRGYQEYLARQERLAYVQANREAALDMVAAGDTTTLPEATLQIIASQYYDFMGGFSAIALKEKLAEDPLKYTRFLNVFARLAREIVVLKKHRDACSKTAAAELQELDPDRHLADSEYQLLANKMDKVFKIRRRPAGGAAGPPPGYAFFAQLQASQLKAQGSAPGTDAFPAPAPVGPLPGKDAVPRVPNSAEIENQKSKIKIPDKVPQSKIKNQNSKMEEHCLECGHLLPALLADGGRPQELCENCGEMLRRPGIYWKPSLDRCPDCNAAQPHPSSTGERYSQHCLKCGVFLPPYKPPSNAAPEPPVASSAQTG